MKRLTIDFVTAKRWFVPLAWLIRAVEGVPFSHLYFAFNEDGEDKVFQSVVFRGVEEVPDAQAKDEYRLLYRFVFYLTDEEFKLFRDFCKEQYGKKYPLLQLLGILTAKIFGLKSNPFSKGPEDVVCAELLLKLMRQLPRVFVDQQKLDGVDPDVVGLRDLYWNLATYQGSD
jgi:hypothetical protein